MRRLLDLFLKLSFLSILTIIVTGCIDTEALLNPQPATPTPSEDLPAEQASTPSTQSPAPDPSPRSLTILYTNDEHGWMEGVNEDTGAAHLMGTWEEEHGYDPDGPFLILSGGDMWTGPAISTWFQGESMAEVMNAMGYAAAAVGNHEFDFGLEVLKARADESSFPFVAANIRNKSDGRVPTEWGIQPFIIVEVNDIQIGITGLATKATPRTTNPVNVASFDFIDYEAALREIVPQMVGQGAELILVPAHVCGSELEALARKIEDLPIHMLGGGHCNELYTAADQTDPFILLGGSHMATYAFAEIEFDTAADELVSVETGTAFTSSRSAPNAEVAAVVEKWQAETDAELNVVIGYTQSGMPRRSQAQQDLITETWLLAYPTADVAMTNMGGFRADIPQGEITYGDIVGVFPFENVIIEVQLTGRQLLDILRGEAEDVALGGLERQGSRWVLASGAELDPDQTYSVLVNDFMYAGGSGFDELAEYDPEGYNTAINWRQPLIDWLLLQESSQSEPIDAAVTALGQ